MLILASRSTIHIGGDLSATDILTVLWQNILEYDEKDPTYEYRDRFVLSKGHCAAAVAFNMAKRGCFKKQSIFDEYATDNCRFSMSPCRHINKYFESSATGSLGQGLPLSCGISLALKVKNNYKSKVYVLLGDGELQEGSNWESIMYAGHKKLNNLIAIIDNNELQFDGKTKHIVNIENINAKFEAFKWKTYHVDGHNIEDLLTLFESIHEQEYPILINTHTVKGKGVGYMENNYLWHAGKLDNNLLKEALLELKKNYGRE